MDVRSMTARRGVMMACAVLMVTLPVGRSSAAQTPAPIKAEDLVGVWEGVAQGANGDVGLSANFTVKDGKLGGTIDSSMGRVDIISAALADDTLTMAIEIQGMPGTLKGRVQGSRIDGVWVVGEQSGPFVLTKTGAAATPGTAATTDPVSGEWEGEAVVQGQAMPFTLTLKLTGDAVTGEIASSMGKVPLASGAWKDGTLLITFPYVGGEPVSMGGQLQTGKFAGVLDYNKGESQGTWTATRK